MTCTLAHKRGLCAKAASSQEASVAEAACAEPSYNGSLIVLMLAWLSVPCTRVDALAEVVQPSNDTRGY